MRTITRFSLKNAAPTLRYRTRRRKVRVGKRVFKVRTLAVILTVSSFLAAILLMMLVRAGSPRDIELDYSEAASKDPSPFKENKLPTTQDDLNDAAKWVIIPTPVSNKPPTYHSATYFQSRNGDGKDKDDLRFSCSLKPGGNRKKVKSASDGAPSLARPVVFQSNGAHQLQNFMAYYTQVIDMEDIVIINHQTKASNADQHTDDLLNEYNSLGSDVWDCIGSFAFKAEMWSWVTLRYTDTSEFVFPLDIDEYIAVLRPSMSTTSNDDAGYSEVLSWNKEHLSNALHKLQDTGKPFKIEMGQAYPVDCRISHWGGSSSETMDNFDGITIKTHQSQIQRPVHYEKSVVERLQYVARKKYDRAHCMDKNFYRGKDFNFTDTGNHHGQTHIQKQSVNIGRCTALQDGSTKYVQDADQHSDIFIVHMQSTTFEEWLMHALRGASDRGFNHLSELNECKEGMQSIHYCLGWKRLVAARFDLREMKTMYQGFCAGLANGRIPVPITQIFHSSKV